MTQSEMNTKLDAMLQQEAQVTKLVEQTGTTIAHARRTVQQNPLAVEMAQDNAKE